MNSKPYVAKYIKRILEDYPEAKSKYKLVWVFKSRGSSRVMPVGPIIWTDLPGLCLKIDSSGLNLDKLHALYFISGHEMSHLVNPGAYNSNAGKLWVVPTLDNHIKSLIKCCKECYCDIWGYDIFYKLNQVYPSEVSEGYIKRIMDGYVKNPKILLNNNDRFFKDVKSGYLHPEARMQIIKIHLNGNDTIKHIVRYYYLTMEKYGVTVKEDELLTKLRETLKSDYKNIYQLLGGN